MSERERLIAEIRAHLVALNKALDSDPLHWLLLDRHIRGLYKGMAALVALEFRARTLINPN